MISPKLKTFLPGLIMLGLMLANVASAQLVNCGRVGQNPCQISDLIFTIDRIINFLLSWAWIVSIFYIMWAGYDMMFSGGNTEALQSGKDKFRHAIIGFFLIMASYLLINWIVGLFTTGTAGSCAYDIVRNLIPNISRPCT